MIINLLTTIIAVNSLNCGTANDFNFLENEHDISDNCLLVSESMGFDNPNEDQYAIKDLNGNIFIVQENKGGGFLIFDPTANDVIESTTTATCPFVFDSLHDNYYFGPMNYYYKEGNYFYHYKIDNCIIDLSNIWGLQENFTTQLEDFRAITSDESYEIYVNDNKENLRPPLRRYQSGNKTYINNYQYIKNMEYPFNWDGSCGFVAASIVLNYWDKTVHSGTVASQFLNENGELNSTMYSNPNINLKDKLVEYNDGNADSTARTVSKSVNKYCNDFNVNGSASWYLGKIGLETSLANEKPAIMFGWFPNVQSGGHVNHAITCYGIDHRWWGGYYIVNYGWGSEYNEVSLGFGFVGETMTFCLDEESYATSYTISPSDYGFPQSYCSNETRKKVSFGSLSFTTNRLRCGYIENQFINLSPRKNGFNTAYIEYEFINPIISMDINISFWSDDERYEHPNNAYAFIQYKNLYTDNWIDKCDLLNDISLSTDRNNQSKLHFDFPFKSREIRIIARFDTIFGLNDRNKGRISIGNITISSYY